MIHSVMAAISAWSLMQRAQANERTTSMDITINLAQRDVDMLTVSAATSNDFPFLDRITIVEVVEEEASLVLWRDSQPESSRHITLASTRYARLLIGQYFLQIYAIQWETTHFAKRRHIKCSLK